MSYKLISESRRKARKEHRCIWCGEKIIVGEVYLREKSVYYGDFQDHKWHLECENDCSEENAGYSEFEIEPYENKRPKKS